VKLNILTFQWPLMRSAESPACYDNGNLPVRRKTTMGDPNEPMVRSDGTYATTKLRQDVITAAVVQTCVNGVDGRNPGLDQR
jgi:hypothetical protein